MRYLILVPVLGLLSGCNPFANSWADDCEDAFVPRLRSPSTYKRIETSIVHQDIRLDDYITSIKNMTPVEAEFIRRKNPPIKRWFVEITYDAANAYGTPVRDRFACEEYTETGSEPKGGRSDFEKKMMMKVNGESGLDIQKKALLQQ